MVHGWRSSTCAVAGFREIVIAKVPPLTGKTVSRHVVVTRVKLRTPWCVLLVDVVVQIRLRVHRKLVHVTTESRRATTAYGARFASCVEGDVVGRESAFRNGRRPRRSSQANGRNNGDAAALRVEGRRDGGRREDCPDLRSGSAAHENWDSMESFDMVACVHFVI